MIDRFDLAETMDDGIKIIDHEGIVDLTSAVQVVMMMNKLNENNHDLKNENKKLREALLKMKV